jgi:hypothetical protein
MQVASAGTKLGSWKAGKLEGAAVQACQVPGESGPRRHGARKSVSQACPVRPKGHLHTYKQSHRVIVAAADPGGACERPQKLGL